MRVNKYINEGSPLKSCALSEKLSLGLKDFTSFRVSVRSVAPLTAKYRLRHNSALLIIKRHLSLLSPKEQISSFLGTQTQAGFIRGISAIVFVCLIMCFVA